MWLQAKADVTGRPVRVLVCPTLALIDQVCSVGTRPHLRIRRPLVFRDALVLTQLDLTSLP